MKRLLFTSGLLLMSLITFSQNGIYRTYEDFKNNKLEDLGEFEYKGNSTANAHINYKINGKKKKLNCKNFWGFMYKSHLFRNNHDYAGLAYKVMSKGDYIYYENGSTYIQAIDNLEQGITKDIKITGFGYRFPISLDFNSKFISTKKKWSEFKKLEKKNSRFTNLKACLETEGVFINKRVDCIREDINETKNFYPWENRVSPKFFSDGH